MNGCKTILCTGGIGSGKSFVVRALQIMGVPSFDMDSCAKTLYGEDPALLADVASVVGGDIIEEGRLVRRRLSERIFSCPSLLEKVEALVHPEVLRRFESWKSQQEAPIVVVESAILLQKPSLCGIADFVLWVTSPVEERMERVIRRDGSPRQEVLRRMAAQTDLSARADYIIETNDRQPIIPALKEIIEQIKNGKDRS